MGSLLLSLGSWCTQGFVCILWASLVGLRFYFKCDCAPPAVFLGLLLIAMSVLFHSVVSDITLRYFANRGPYSQSYGFSSSHAWMQQLDRKGGWAPKNWCFWTLVLEKTLESPLACKEIKQVNPIGNQPWIFIGRTDAEAEAPTTWCKELTHWKRPWCWERLKAGGERDNRGWDGWIASPTQWTWVWANSRR